MQKYFIANWKMNLRRTEQQALIQEIIKAECYADGVQTIVCPSYVNIPAAVDAFEKTPIAIGAQDVSWESAGAMTGEVSPDMLKDFGIKHVIIGHSERRYSMDENEKMIAAKVASAIGHGLIPIICVGETFEQRKAGQTEVVIDQQVRSALHNVHNSDLKQIMIAYEPVWVIGSGQAVEPQEAITALQVIGETIADVYEGIEKDKVIRLYGGSVNKDNIEQFIASEIDGVLVGGASLKAEQIQAMVTALAQQ